MKRLIASMLMTAGALVVLTLSPGSLPAAGTRDSAMIPDIVSHPTGLKFCWYVINGQWVFLPCD